MIKVPKKAPPAKMANLCQNNQRNSNHPADFEEARQLMEGLATLRPRLLQSTLRA